MSRIHGGNLGFSRDPRSAEQRVGADLLVDRLVHGDQTSKGEPSVGRRLSIVSPAWSTPCERRTTATEEGVEAREHHLGPRHGDLDPGQRPRVHARVRAPARVHLLSRASWTLALSARPARPHHVPRLTPRPSRRPHSLSGVPLAQHVPARPLALPARPARALPQRASPRDAGSTAFQLNPRGRHAFGWRSRPHGALWRLRNEHRRRFRSVPARSGCRVRRHPDSTSYRATRRRWSSTCVGAAARVGPGVGLGRAAVGASRRRRSRGPHIPPSSTWSSSACPRRGPRRASTRAGTSAGTTARSRRWRKTPSGCARRS